MAKLFEEQSRGLPVDKDSGDDNGRQKDNRKRRIAIDSGYEITTEFVMIPEQSS